MRRHLAYAAAGAVVLALAGCGDDEPTPQVADPTTAPSASSSASESAAAKEPWEEKSDDGAIAFVEHWLAVFNEMQVTGEQADLRAISDRKCQSCSNIFGKAESIYGVGGSIQTKGWLVEQVGISEGTTPSSRQVAVRIRQAPQTVLAADGQKTTYPGGPLTVTATVNWGDGAWTMQELELQS